MHARERDAVIDHVVHQLTEAMHRVRAAEPNQGIEGSGPDVGELNELITAATHETASMIGFFLADIRALQTRLRLREAFTDFTDDQFDTIVNQGWSLDLVNRICAATTAPNVDMKFLSHRIRELVAAYSALPNTVAKALKGIDARRDTKRAVQEDFVGARLAAAGTPTRKATLAEVAITGQTNAGGYPVFELHCDLDGDAILVRTVLPSVRIAVAGKQIEIIEHPDRPGHYLYVRP